MINLIPPAFIYFAGAILLPLLKERRLRQALQLLVPLIAFINLLYMDQGTYWSYHFLGYELIFGRVDKLSLCFGYVFAIIAFLGMVYSLHVRESGQQTAAFLYAGSALGVTFAGDLLTLFAFWEIMAVASVFLILYKKDKASLDAGFRYILVHIFGGCALLAGIIMHVVNTGSIQFGLMEYAGLASQLILIGFILNAAVPPLHAWLADAYPEATITGAVFLSAFTTKSAVYVLIRGFPGAELLVWLGAIMAVYGVVYAIIENDIRRLLSYHIISQVGYMVCGIGLGTELGLNGSVAHAFCHILYKALLFMGTGAVIYITGKRKLTELQGRDLYKMMPICLSLYMIAGFSISGVPLFNGFISKTMVVAAAGEAHRAPIHILLHLASIGTFFSTTLKLPYCTWFGKAQDKIEEVEAKEPPLNMLVAMGLTAFLCIFIGCYPKVLYGILPYQVNYHPYSPYHVAATMQLLLFTAVAFWLYKEKVGGHATISLDTDWFYRKSGNLLILFCVQLQNFRIGLKSLFSRIVAKVVNLSKKHVSFENSIGLGVILVVILLFFYILIYFIINLC